MYILPSISRSDGGTYSCATVNPATGQNQTAIHELTITGMRQQKMDTKNVNTVLSQDLEKICICGFFFQISQTAHLLLEER